MGRETAFSFKATMAKAPATITDNTAQVSAILDMQNFDGATLLITLGTLSDADCTTTLLLEHGDNSSLSDAATVTEALVGTAAGASPIFSDDGKVAKVGYFGAKRYLRATLTPSGNTGNIPFAMTWLQHGQRSGIPTSQIV